MTKMKAASIDVVYVGGYHTEAGLILRQMRDQGMKSQLISGDAPSKESFLHLAMYQERERNQAVVHLHATHSVAVSVLEGLDPDDLLPPLTAYYVMRIGTLPLVPYFAPGDMALADAVRGYAGRHHALLLANHGPVVAGASLAAAADAVEELEATAKLYLLLQGQRIRPLNPSRTVRNGSPDPSGLASFRGANQR